MNYYSTNKRSGRADFKEATLKGLAPDKGLYFPEYIPQLDSSFIQQIEKYSNAEIAFHVMAPYVGASIPPAELQVIARESIAFDIPLVKITDKIFSLELFHGPTLAFKDVGARFMSRCLGYFAREKNEKIIVLVATSGDTGGAVANGFYKVEGVEVVILYPSGKVSNVQEKQFTTLGNNIHALEIEGDFDDCQRMVKEVFADERLNKNMFLTSANSINIARWLPQQFYYFFAWKQWADKANPPVIAVPSGNFGNVCAGLLAYKSGLPVKHFIAASNVNDTVPEYFHTGRYEPKKAIATISNAMDVGDPSNFVRILELFGQDIQILKTILSSYRVTDEQTVAAMQEVLKANNYLLDPHGAVAWVALNEYLSSAGNKKGIILETAHPVKFHEVVEKITQEKIPVPESVVTELKKEKKSIKMTSDSNSLKDFLGTLK